MRAVLAFLFLGGSAVAALFFFFLVSLPRMNDIDLIYGELAIGFGVLTCAITGSAMLLHSKLVDIRETQLSIASRGADSD